MNLSLVLPYSEGTTTAEDQAWLMSVSQLWGLFLWVRSRARLPTTPERHPSHGRALPDQPILPDPTTIRMIDVLSAHCGWSEEKEVHGVDDSSKQGREQKGSRGQESRKVTVMCNLLFSSCEISAAVQLPVSKQGSRRLGRNQCYYTTCSWLADKACKAKGLTSCLFHFFFFTCKPAWKEKSVVSKSV